MTPSLSNASSIHRVIAEMLEADLPPGEAIQFKVVSNSMGPLILRGDGVMVEKVAWPEIKRGEIILIQRQDDYLTHRLILKSPKKCLTKGDNNLLPDPPATTDVIIGRVFSLRRGDQTIDLQTREWQFINLLLANLGYLEWKAFSIQRYLRLPFRLGIKIIQTFFMPKRKSYVDS